MSDPHGPRARTSDRLLRWLYRRFRTRVEYIGRSNGQRYRVTRPDWWQTGCTSGVVDSSLVQARRRLDEWQDDMWRRARAA